MDSQKLLTKRNIIGLVLTLILLIAIPLGIYLAQTTQIFKPRASAAVANFSGVTIADGGLTDGQQLGPIKFDFTTVAGKNVGISLWKGISSPAQKCNPDGGCTAANFHHVDTAGTNKDAGWALWEYTTNVPFLIEYTNGGDITYQRTFEAVKPNVVVKVLDGNTPITDLNSLVAEKPYTIKIEASDNAAVTEPNVVMTSGDVNCNTAISNIQISAASGRADKNGEWINADSGRCPADGKFTYTRTLKAPFLVEYSVADINKNLTTGSLTGSLASGGQGSNTTTALDCYIDATGFTKDSNGYFVKTVTVNTPINFSARYNWPAGTIASKQTGDLMVVNVPDGGGGNCWKTGGTSDCSNPPALTSNHQSINWTPTAAGTYSVMCRSVVPNVAECRGDHRFSSGVSICPNEQNEKSGHVTVTVNAPVSNTANCTITDNTPITMKVGDPAITISATYSSNNPATTYGEIDVWKGATQITDGVSGAGKYSMDPAAVPSNAGNTGNSITFAPQAAGTYKVACRASNGVQTECHAPGITGGTTPSLSCGDNSVKTITVNPGGGNPVDGGWSAWSPITCPTACGLPASTQTRTCTNPAPANGGTACVGSTTAACSATAACASPSPSASSSPATSPSPSPEAPVVSLAFDTTNVPFATEGLEINLPIRLNTAITPRIYDVTILDMTLKYNNEDFEYVDLVVAPNIGFNTRCSETGAGTGANICKLRHIRANVGVGPKTGTIQLVTSTPIGTIVSGDPIIANLKLRGKKVTAKSTIEFIKDRVTATGTIPGVILGVDATNLDLEIKPRIFTKNYQICEANGDIEWNNPASKPVSVICLDKYKDLEYKNFRTTGKVIAKDYEIYDQSPGLKTIFVKFTSVDNQEKIERILINYKPNPSISGANSGITCNFVGEGMEALIYGTNFYAKGAGSGVKINNQAAEIIEWKEDVPPPGTLPVTPAAAGIGSTASSGVGSTAPIATSPSPAAISTTGIAPKLWLARAKIARSSKDLVPVELTTVNGTKVTGSCQVGATTADLTIQSKCGPQPTTIKDDVDITFYENTANITPIGKAKAKVDSKGKPLTFTPPTLQQNKDYVVIVKSPKTLARRIDFKTQTGTSILETIDLPTGNIAPASNPDSKINSLDRSELVKQWSLTADVVKTGDFNEDGRINSIDWSCMRENFNKDDETFTGAR